MANPNLTFHSFWLVCREGRTLEGTFRHYDATSARQEASRLAKLNPGVRFYVLQHIGSVIACDVVWTADDDLPF